MPRALVLLVICLSLTGCFVFDEIDAGMESMNKGPKPAPAEAAKPGQPDPAKPGPPAGDAWWASARSLNEAPDAEAADPGDPKAPVTCRIGGSTRFMRRGDCLSQGGTPK